MHFHAGKLPRFAISHKSQQRECSLRPHNKPRASKLSPTGISVDRAAPLPLPRIDREREMDIRESKIMPHQRVRGRPLAGQKALITGANSGIGKAVAIAMAEAGASVVVNYVTGDDEAHAVADQITGLGGRAIVHRADVSNEYQIAEMFEEACAVFGTLDIVVANAGLQRDCAVSRNDARAVEYSDQRQSHRPISLRARCGPRVLAARTADAGLSSAWQNHLHEFGARGHSLGRARQLRRVEGRRDDADENDRAGAGAARHSREWAGARCDAHAD